MESAIFFWRAAVSLYAVHRNMQSWLEISMKKALSFKVNGAFGTFGETKKKPHARDIIIHSHRTRL